MHHAMEPYDRQRRLILQAAAGLFAFQLGGCEKLLTPQEARRQGAAPQHLSEAEMALLEAFGEALVPGARAAGVAHYVDVNLKRAAAESLLTVRYLDVPPPFLDFYRAGLRALDRYSGAQAGRGFAELSGPRRDALIAPMLAGAIAGWEGPPAPLFYLAVRGDAADMVYGTAAAFERMNIPYLPHIAPPRPY